ncbi:MAG TPA: hypothetical protein DEP72_05005 [Clostridiales bacterium]|nr:MAG: hypothetical protein A2Y18_02105 [Clostridiales bacterium GWD2_32_19]HCC07499.1 hypothetical protein [Clostridiales bacterium]
MNERYENLENLYLNHKSTVGKNISKINKRVIIVISIVLIATIVGFSINTAIKYIPNFNSISLYEAVPTFELNKIGVVIEDKYASIDNPITLDNTEILVPVEFIKNNIDKYIFWDEKEKVLTITTQDKVIRMKSEGLTSFVNNQPVSLDIQVKMFDDVPYIPILEYADLYNINVKYIDESKLLVIDYKNRKHEIGSISKNTTYIRQAATIKSQWIDKLSKGEKVYVYKEYNNFKYVRSEKGFLGYVRSSDISDINEEQSDNSLQIFSSKVEKWTPKKGKISMLWRQVFKPENVDASKMVKQEGVEVLSPTWFNIINENGDMKSIANKEYVKWAHENGYEVWPLVANPFANKEMTHIALINTNTREKIIRQILSYAALYDLDGINIDFEGLKPESGEYFIQFLRELAPYMSEQGLVLSVDVYMPSIWTTFYNRTEIAKIADYICVMAYDEHWSTSPVSGSVASADWIEEGIINTLVEVPKEKIIMGVPFYTRLWTEKDGVLVDKPKAMNMENAKQLLNENKAAITWLPEDGQYYGEYTVDGLTYKIWLEDEKSIEEKLNIVNKYELAGAAFWKDGMEKDSIRGIIKEKLWVTDKTQYTK